MKKKDIKVCCKDFAEQMLQEVRDGDISFGGGFISSTQGEYDEEEKVWNVNGCCGGGCFVITGLKYCPWCGKKIV